MEKTRVKIKCDDVQYQEYLTGDEGYIDGYISNNGIMYASVIIKNKVVLIKPHQLEVIANAKQDVAKWKWMQIDGKDGEMLPEFCDNLINQGYKIVHIVGTKSNSNILTDVTIIIEKP